MPTSLHSQVDSGDLTIYEIRIKGHLDSQWGEWFGGATVTLQDNGETLIISPVIDQSALHGLLKKVRDLGMTLLSVNRIGHSATDRPNIS